MLILALSAAIVVVIDPPAPPPFESCAAYRVQLSDGSEIRAVRATYLPDSLGLVVVPERAGRIYCSGFEASA